MQKLFIPLIVAVVTACRFSGKSPAGDAVVSPDFPYDLHAPDKTFNLPNALYEISGIAAVNDSVIACVGDERGTVYFFNLNTGKTADQLKFTSRGDFEDLTVIGTTMYVLNSNGELWTIQDFAGTANVSSKKLDIEKPFELEGMCHRKDTLFVAAKHFQKKKKGREGGLPVWKATLPGTELSLLFDVPDAVRPEKISVPFHTSGIFFHEQAQQWLIISTNSKVLIRCDYSGNILATQNLSGTRYTQPEGITMTPSENLLISNEGKEGHATLLLFRKKGNLHQ